MRRWVRGMKLPQNVSESTKRRNPELYGLCPVAAVEREPRAKDALVKVSRPQRRRRGRVEVLVTIIVFRARCLDDDNSASGGTKALRDAIAASLGYDDGDSRIRFQYGQCQTAGATGCIVRIETV